MNKNVIKVGDSTLVNMSGTFHGRFVADGDVKFNYVTLYIPTAQRVGLLPPDFVARQGDLHLFIVDGVSVVGKVNRRTLDTIAFHWPACLPLPKWIEEEFTDGKTKGHSTTVDLSAVYVGFTGLHIVPKQRRSPVKKTVVVETIRTVETPEPSIPRPVLQSVKVTGRDLVVEHA